MENQITVEPVNSEGASIPEVQMDDYSSNAVQELVEEMEEKDKLAGIEESKQEEKPEAKEEAQKFARKFAALSRKEKQLKAREAEYAKKFEELEAKLANIEKPKVEEKKIDIPFEKRFKQDPFKALEDIGLPYDKLTELALNDRQLTPDMQLERLRDELENGYKSKFEQLEKRLNEKEQNEKRARYDNIQKNYINKVKGFVDTNSEEYEFIKANNAEQVVYDVVESHYKESGKILTIKEAADAVESHLEEEAEKLLKLNKVGKRLQAYMEQQNKPEESTIPKPVTLTNAHSQQQADEPDKQMLSDEESKREIAKMLRWID